MVITLANLDPDLPLQMLYSSRQGDLLLEEVTRAALAIKVLGVATAATICLRPGIEEYGTTSSN